MAGFLLSPPKKNVITEISLRRPNIFSLFFKKKKSVVVDSDVELIHGFITPFLKTLFHFLLSLKPSANIDLNRVPIVSFLSKRKHCITPILGRKGW